jgi:hypothetical protein
MILPAGFAAGNLIMLRCGILCAALALAAAPVLGQTPPADTGGKQPTSTVPTNTGPENTHTVWSPQLPTPAVGDDAPPAAFVKAAQAALAAGRLGEAQEAIERAESRALDRSVRPSRASAPSRQPLVQQLAQARQMLGAGDRMGAMLKLDQALKNPEATEQEE